MWQVRTTGLLPGSGDGEEKTDWKVFQRQGEGASQLGGELCY